MRSTPIPARQYPEALQRLRSTGFTLVELMIALAVAAIVLTMGIPGFQDLIQNNRRVTAVNELVSGLHLARSEAFKRNRTVSVCPSADGVNCGGAWAAGWLVFVNADNDTPPAVTDGDEVVRYIAAPGRGLPLAADDASASGVSYSARGRPTRPAIFAYCDPRGGDNSRSLTLGLGGHIQLEQGGGVLCF